MISLPISYPMKLALSSALKYLDYSLVFSVLWLFMRMIQQNNYKSILMKTQQYRSKLQQELTQNYNVYAMLQKQSTSTLTYQQILYILFNGRIPLSKIAYFRRKKYRSEEPSLKKQALLEDALKLKEEVINKAWRFQKADDVNKAIKNTRPQKQVKPNQPDSSHQTTIQNAEQKQPDESSERKQHEVESVQKQGRRQAKTMKQKDDNSQIKERKQALQQMLIILQAKLNTSRNEQEAAGYQKEYNKCFKQLTFLRNKRRVEREENLLKKIATQISETVPQKITNLLIQMNEIKNKNAKILHKQPSYKEKIPKTQEISRINLIFLHYSKKQTKSTNRYFSDLQKQQNKLLLETFIKFAQDWRLDRIIPFEQIMALFKARSKGNRFVDSLQFSEILADIHASQCIKEEKPINNDSISQYMQEYIVCDAKINKFIMNSGDSAKRQDSVQYQFKPKSHSGKYLHDIAEELELRKKTVDFLAGPGNNQKFKDRKVKKRNHTLESSRAQDYQIAGLDTIQHPSQVNLNDSVNSYAFRFKLKNTKSRIKTQGIIKSIQNTQAHISKNQALIKTLEANRENINNRNQSRYQSAQKKKKAEENDQNELNEDIEEDKFIDKVMNKNSKKKSVPFEGFQDLIEESSEDEYLNKHLLPPIESKRLARHIHY